MSRIDKVIAESKSIAEGALQYISAMNYKSPWFPRMGRVIDVPGQSNAIRVKVPGEQMNKQTVDYWRGQFAQGGKDHGLTGVLVKYEQPNTFLITWM